MLCGVIVLTLVCVNSGFNNSPHGILQQLQEDELEVVSDVTELDVGGPVDDEVGGKGVVLSTYLSRFLCTRLHTLSHREVGADDADLAFFGFVERHAEMMSD